MGHKKKYNYEESEIQKAGIRWANIEFNRRREWQPYRMQQEDKRGNIKLVAPLVHIPNHIGGSFGATASINAMGQKSGIQDLLLLVSRGGYGLAAIEMKTENGTLKPNQIHCGDFMEKHYKYYICRSLDGFQDAVIEYMGAE